MTQTSRKPLKDAALAAALIEDMEAKKTAYEQKQRDRQRQREKLSETILKVLEIRSDDPEVTLDDEGNYAVVEGIYFRQASRMQSGEWLTGNEWALEVFIDFGEGEGAQPTTIRRLADLGRVLEGLEGAYLVDMREYVTILRGEDDDIEVKRVHKAEAELLLRTLGGWSKEE